jgi:hypothetical protein
LSSADSSRLGRTCFLFELTGQRCYHPGQRGIGLAKSSCRCYGAAAEGADEPQVAAASIGQSGEASMEVSARYDAMTAASTRFASGSETLIEIERSVQRACTLAAEATGDAGASAEMVRFCDRMSAVMDDTARRLLDVAGGLRTALDAVWTAAGGDAGDPGPPGPAAAPRPGRPQ